MSSKYSVISLDDGNEDDNVLLTTINSNVQKGKIPTITKSNSKGNVAASNLINTVLNHLVFTLGLSQ